MFSVRTTLEELNNSAMQKCNKTTEPFKFYSKRNHEEKSFDVIASVNTDVNRLVIILSFHRNNFKLYL